MKTNYTDSAVNEKTNKMLRFPENAQGVCYFKLDPELQTEDAREYFIERLLNYIDHELGVRNARVYPLGNGCMFAFAPNVEYSVISQLDRRLGPFANFARSMIVDAKLREQYMGFNARLERQLPYESTWNTVERAMKGPQRIFYNPNEKAETALKPGETIDVTIEEPVPASIDGVVQVA